MELWQLIISVTGVVIGFLVGFFAEPVKTYFSNLHTKKLLHKALYKEISFFYARMIDINSNNIDYDWDIYKKSLRIIARFESHEYAKLNPMLFHQIEESSAISQVYANYENYIEGFLFTNVKQHVVNAKGITEIVEELIIKKRLDKKLFLVSIDKEHSVNLLKRLQQKEKLFLQK